MDSFMSLRPVTGEPSTVTTSAEQIRPPEFKASVIQKQREDGYWIETFHFDVADPVPGVIVSGLNSGVVEFLDNPIAACSHTGLAGTELLFQIGADVATDQDWQLYEVKKYNTPVACVAADIRGIGLTDLIVCHDYGSHMLNVKPDGGKISWLQNPGRQNLGKGHWVERFIGRWPDDFSGGYLANTVVRSFLEIVAASVVRGPHDKVTPIPVIRFQAPERVLEATEWPREVIDDENFTIIHEITVKKFNGPTGLDSMLISSREGTTWLHYMNGHWNRELITIGEPKETRQSYTSEKPGSGDHWGTGNADAGRVGTDPFAYIVTLDPFHGTTLCVYTKEHRGLRTQRWKRHTLDVFGTPTQRMKWGDGPGHFVVCADFDGDGDDEILISLFGSLDRNENGEPLPVKPGENPNKGVMYYKVLDLARGIFGRWRVADESSARIALGNYMNSRSIDFASIEYNVEKYYEEPNPRVMLYANQRKHDRESTKEPCAFASVWDEEGIIYLSNPRLDTQLLVPTQMPLIEVADYLIRLEIYPKGHNFNLDQGHGIKVLYGSVTFDQNGKPRETRSPLNVPQFSSSSTMSRYRSATASPNSGAIILHIVPINGQKDKVYASVADIPVSTKLDVSKYSVTLTPLRFKQVSTLWWGKNDSFYKDVPFYEMSGFHLRFLDPKVPLAHIRFWAAGTRVNGGVHNHKGDIFSEIHVALSPGTRGGGMSKLRKEWETKDPPEKYNFLPDKAFVHLSLDRLEEHGGMWERDYYQKPVRDQNRAVKYPWHKWQSGDGRNMDVWMAIEFNPDLDLAGDQASGQALGESDVISDLEIDSGEDEVVVTVK